MEFSLKAIKNIVSLTYFCKIEKNYIVLWPKYEKKKSLFPNNNLIVASVHDPLTSC